MLKIDDSAIIRYEKLLRNLNRQGIRYANKSAVAGMAFQCRKEAIEIVGEKLLLRNKWTVQGMRVEKRRDSASMGSIRGYMERVEFGGTKSSVGVPTSAAAGQGMKTRPRTRVVRRALYMSKISLPSRVRRAKSRMQANAIAFRRAKPFAYMDLGRRKGIFRRRGRKVTMIYDLSKPRVDIPKNPWLKPAVEATRPHSPKIYFDALEYQLKRKVL